jgi:hypothetical protein
VLDAVDALALNHDALKEEMIEPALLIRVEVADPGAGWRLLDRLADAAAYSLGPVVVCRTAL